MCWAEIHQQAKLQDLALEARAPGQERQLVSRRRRAGSRDLGLLVEDGLGAGGEEAWEQEQGELSSAGAEVSERLAAGLRR